MARKKKAPAKEVEVQDVSDVETPVENLEMTEVTEVEAAIKAGKNLELVEEQSAKTKEKAKPEKSVKEEILRKRQTENTAIPQGTFGIFFH